MVRFFGVGYICDCEYLIWVMDIELRFFLKVVYVFKDLDIFIEK